jgi:hypothetical protein
MACRQRRSAVSFEFISASVFLLVARLGRPYQKFHERERQLPLFGIRYDRLRGIDEL